MGLRSKDIHIFIIYRAKTQPKISKKKEESDSCDSDESSEVEAPAKEKKPTSGTKRKSESSDDSSPKRQKVEEKEDSSSSEEAKPKNSNTRVPYSRIKHNYADNLGHEFQDNTFEAKARYGQGGDDYGIASNERLRVTRGKGFRKEKTKMKKKNFHGAGQKIVYKVNSIKFD